MNVDEKLFKVRFNVDQENPHLGIDRAKCQGCTNRVCLFLCPSKVFKLEGDEITLSWQECMECGTCRVSCPEGSIEWRYHRGGFGVCFRCG